MTVFAGESDVDPTLAVPAGRDCFSPLALIKF
jgi:hypothetical protein